VIVVEADVIAVEAGLIVTEMAVTTSGTVGVAADEVDRGRAQHVQRQRQELVTAPQHAYVLAHDRRRERQRRADPLLERRRGG